jgi:CBS domain containing-hemolysin-like protein
MHPYLVILICLLSSAFFAGLEIAFLTANKLRIELESNQGYLPSRIISYFLKKPSQFIATTLVGNNIALVVYGINMAIVLQPKIESFIKGEFAILCVQVLCSTLFVVITAEFLPKALFRINPNGFLSLLAIPFSVLYVILYPIVFASVTLTESLLKRIFKMHSGDGGVVFSRVDLDRYVRQFTSESRENEQIDHEITIFKNALDFDSVKLRECMIPRNEMIAVEVNRSVEELREKFIETHLSKIIIYRENLENIEGYVHSSELFRKPSGIREILRPIALLPETMPAKAALAQLRRERKSMAVVVDEFGGTSGLITTEDIMEEIFGEIEDEHDKEELTEKNINAFTYHFSGRLEIDYLNQKYKLHLPKEDSFETLAGLFLDRFSSIPSVGDEVLLESCSLKVVGMKGNRIELLELVENN